jgi:hypothetical protein
MRSGCGHVLCELCFPPGAGCEGVTSASEVRGLRVTWVTHAAGTTAAAVADDHLGQLVVLARG